jgi:hypothetical protein
MDIPEDLISDLEQFANHFADSDGLLRLQLADLLNKIEIAASEKRLQALIKRSIFPNPGPGRHYPWPPV